MLILVSNADISVPEAYGDIGSFAVLVAAGSGVFSLVEIDD